MKTCSKCKIEKLKSDFYKDNRSPDKLTYKCKECSKESERTYYHKHNSDRKFKAKLRRLKNDVFTLEEYNNMVLEQNNNCGICKTSMISPCIDHNHSTGKIRMLLCHHCNTMIGLARENKVILNSAIKYLEKFE